MASQKQYQHHHSAALGEFLRERRRKANLTQREVGIALGYSSGQFISNFERGRASPPLQKLKIMHSLYGGSAHRLIHMIIEAERLFLRDALFKDSRPGRRTAKIARH